MSGRFTPDIVHNAQNRALKKQKLDSNPRYGPVIALRSPSYLTLFVPNIFFEVQLSPRIYRLEVLYKNWRQFNSEKQGFP